MATLNSWIEERCLLHFSNFFRLFDEYFLKYFSKVRIMICHYKQDHFNFNVFLGKVQHLGFFKRIWVFIKTIAGSLS